LRNLGWAVSGLLLGACVTINIYFPAAEAEEAARTIVRDVLEEAMPPSETAPDAEEAQPQSGLDTGSLWLRYAGRLIEVAVPAAHAAAPDINIDTPAINSLRSSMGRRQAVLSEYYRSGAIGFDRQGSVAIRDLNLVSLKDRNRLKKLVNDENADRDALYREIARANGHPEWESDIRRTFARVWVEEAARGFWYQRGDGSWAQK
jgi:uncharacterized protein YdbL (DUF1318 family)